MLDNTFTFQVDEADNAVNVATAYRRYDEYANRSVYIGPNHTVAQRETLGFYRSPVKRNGNFPGTAKSAIKLTTDTSVAGVDNTTEISAPIIVDCAFSVPVGTPSSTVLKARQRMIAIMSNDDLFNRLVNQLEV